MTAAKLIEIALERNRNTGMRCAAAARPMRIASISGSTWARLSVRSDCASASAPSAATNRTYVFISCLRSITPPLIDRVPRRAGTRLRARGLLVSGLPGHALPGHAFPGHAFPSEAFPRDVLPRHRVPAHVLPGHALPARARRVDAAVVREVAPHEGLPLDELPHVLRERVAHAVRRVLPADIGRRHCLVRVNETCAAIERRAERQDGRSGLEAL